MEERALSKSTTQSPADTILPKILKENAGFPIIGIGSSAGGLEALARFFRNVPAESGMAFILVQHLDPAHKSILVELLQEAASMPVVQVEEGMKVERDRVYVIPPNKDMVLRNGALHLLEPKALPGLRLPIDFFFRSLADNLRERSIGVILSGMGSDGTLGLYAIKEHAGGTFVQEPSTAKFDGMPQSAIEAGLADVVAAAEELPGKILAYLKHVLLPSEVEQSPTGKTDDHLEQILNLLMAETGQDFSAYKKSMLYRRIERRMGIHQMNRISRYARFLKHNPGEARWLFKELLIGVTRFFRDREAWECLKDKAIPLLLANRRPDEPLKAWVAGCSTGEEAYSLAMVFREILDERGPGNACPLRIFATDPDREALDEARAGLYPAGIAADVSPERMSRFFVKEHDRYRIVKEIRDMVIFAPQNILTDPPFTRLDILSCRNLMIYLKRRMQKKLIPLFHYSLNPDGLLFLGSAESLTDFDELFTPVDSKAKIYKRLPGNLTAEQAEFPFLCPSAKPCAKRQLHEAKPPVNLEAMADRLLLHRFAPAAVLVNGKGDILYVSGRTGKVLEPAVGKANWNIFAMAGEGLLFELHGAFQKALSGKETVTVKALSVKNNGGRSCVDMTVHYIHEPQPLHGMLMIVFSEAAAPPGEEETLKKRASACRKTRLADMEKDLRQTREELRATHEKIRISQEELRTANEELQSLNEELQSNNEELMTSREALQSMNEELQTVNGELNAKVDQLARTNSDTENLLNNTDSAALFLDGSLKIRRFTVKLAELVHLIPADTGRPVSDIASELVYPELEKDAAEVLRTLVFSEKTIATRDGRWFLARIRPYRTPENRADGAILTFLETTAFRKKEFELNEEITVLQQSLSDMNEPFFSLNDRLALSYLNPAAERLLNREGMNVLGRNFFEAFPEAKDPSLKERLNRALREKTFLSCTVHIKAIPAAGPYDVRIYPRAAGISILFQPSRDTIATAPDP